MSKIIFVISIILCLTGCQKQTGSQWLDELVVRDYEDRAKLTSYLGRGDTYFAFGCRQLRVMSPEPRAYWDLAETLANNYYSLRKRAEDNNLLLDLPESGILLSVLPAEPIPESEIASTKLACLQKQEDHLRKIEDLLDLLES